VVVLITARAAAPQGRAQATSPRGEPAGGGGGAGAAGAPPAAAAAAAPPAAARRPPAAGAAQRAADSELPRASFVPQHDDAARAPFSPARTRSMEVEWPCATCTYLNAATALACVMCGTASGGAAAQQPAWAPPAPLRPAAPPPAAPAPQSPASLPAGGGAHALSRAGPWRCRAPGCPVMNGEAAAACGGCGAARGSRGGGGGGGGGALRMAPSGGAQAAGSPAAGAARAAAPAPAPAAAATGAAASAVAAAAASAASAAAAATAAAAAADAAAALPAISAFETARPFQLNESGAPLLDAGEVLYFTALGVDVYDGDAKARGALGGAAAVTSARVLWLGAGGAARLAWPLRALRSAALEDGGLLVSRSPKIVLALTGCGGGGRAAHVKLSFKGGGRADFARALDDARAAAARADAAAAEAAAAAAARAARAAAPAAGGAGFYDAAAARAAEERAARAALAATAFSSLKDLAHHAGEVMREAERAGAELRAARERRGGAGAGAGEDELAALLADMGAIDSPVTHAAAGRGFVDALAREVAEWARPRLREAGGLLPLADVYARVNRARGLAPLISPNDLLAALDRMPALGLGMRARALALGGARGAAPRVLALDDDAAGGAPAARVAALLAARAAAASPRAPHASVSALELAREWRLPLRVAAAHLAAAEAAGSVARDESAAGVRFYENRFAAARGA
jgi:hypothetical protein